MALLFSFSGHTPRMRLQLNSWLTISGWLAIPVDTTQCGCVVAVETETETEGTQISGTPTVPGGNCRRWILQWYFAQQTVQGVLHIEYVTSTYSLLHNYLSNLLHLPSHMFNVLTGLA